MTAGSPPLPTAPLGLAFGGGNASTPKIEVFVDFACPFSGELFRTIWLASRPGGPLYGRAQFVLQLVVQPWHPQSEVMHEAVVAVRALAGSELALSFAHFLWLAYADFVDAAVVSETRMQTAGRLAVLAESVTGVSAAELLPLLTHGDPSNWPTAQMLKWQVRQHRTRGVHVTPTCFVYGIEATQISSSWTVKQWAAMLDELGAAK
ncbi:hypothetical protein T492DRAFT_601756 [Pavlovales sp. CCMP2436]|nr:hypothetical protein T492DRAFT_601756 [Pavlovales sp. CCMP2436]